MEEERKNKRVEGEREEGRLGGREEWGGGEEMNEYAC
jgi:hypothetical protein